MRAIIVDDSRTIRMMLKRFLLAEGFVDLFEGGDGSEALTKLKEVGPVDLAIVDWNMPVMDGLDFIVGLRGQKAFDVTRVVMLTTESETSKVQRARDAGANAFMTKPFNAEALRSTLVSLSLGRRVA